jgi:hypothetical protein
MAVDRRSTATTRHAFASRQALRALGAPAWRQVLL